MTAEIRARINARVPTLQISEVARDAISTLAQDALSKVESGVTSLDAALRLLE